MHSNNIPCYIFSLSIDGLVTELNQLMGEELGYASKEVVGKMRFEDLLTGGSRIFYKTHFVSILMMEGTIEEMYLSLKSKSGIEIPFLLNMRIVRKNGEQEIYGSGLQITKRNKFERDLIEARHAAEKALKENLELNQLKLQLEESQVLLERQVRELMRINEEQLTFNKLLAHDLQEPLRKLQVFSSRLQEKDIQYVSSNSLRYLNRVNDISHYAHELLIRLHGYYSLEVDIKDFKPASFPTVLNTVISKLGLQNIALNIEKLHVQEISGDIPKLTRLFEELIQNSYEFKSIDKPLSIIISTSMVKDNYYQALNDTYLFIDFIKISIKDNSLGFPDRSQSTLFKPLQKYHAQSGMGLGLAYCRKIIELHNGKITMKPVPEGGSEFIVLLPANYSF